MSELAQWLILGGTALTAVLLAFVLARVASGPPDAGREVRDELRAAREESRTAAKDLREEVAGGLRVTGDTLARTLEGAGKAQQAQIEGMTRQLRELAESSQAALDRVRATFDTRVKELQEGNEKKLDEMRRTVDEKLHETLEKRLNESFRTVSERLEAVHKGLGEMQHLATGVGDLKRVLTNVKTRGTWAEVQLAAILEQILAPAQYEKNVQVRADTAERVEYAVRLPGTRDDPGAPVWLPIDSKFPQEDYLRLQDAADRGDPAAVQAAAEDLARAVRVAARAIHDKYVSPPATTDFAVMFLATEGLYAEVLRQPALVDELQQRYRVVVAGPATLAALLSSLRVGFQTLAIEQRTVEMWRVLGGVRAEFVKLGVLLEKARIQVQAAGRALEDTGARTRAIERKLRAVEQLPEAEAAEALALPPGGNADAEEAPVENGGELFARE